MTYGVKEISSAFLVGARSGEVAMRDRLRRFGGTVFLWMKTVFDQVYCLPVLMGFLAAMPYTPLLFSGDQVLAHYDYADYIRFQLPVREYVQDEIFRGRFPIWNPWMVCGAPCHATGQITLAYPLMTPLLLVADANRALQISLFLHVILCYWGQYRLGRYLGLSQLAASIGGLIVAQGGFLTSHLVVGHVMHVFAYSLFPWFFLGVCRICRSPKLECFCFLTIPVAGLFLIGHPQLPYYGFLFGGLWCLGSMAFGSATKHRFRCLFIYGAAIGLGGLISSVQLLPTGELVRSTVRAADRGDRGAVAYAGDLQYAMKGIDLGRLLYPWLIGNRTVGVPELVDSDSYHEQTCYVGFMTWILAFAGIYGATSTHWPRGAFALVLLGLIIGLGNSTPLFHWFGLFAPGLFWFRCPGRCLSFAAILVALLAGLGFDVWTSERERVSPREALRLNVLVLCSLAVAAFLTLRGFMTIGIQNWMSFTERNLGSEMTAGMIVTLIAVSITLIRSRLDSKVKFLSIVLLTSADLGYFNMRQIAFQDRDKVEAPSEMVESGRLFRFIEAKPNSPPKIDDQEYGDCVPVAIRNRLPMFGTCEGGVLPRACNQLYKSLEANRETTLNLASCRFVVYDSQASNRKINDGAKPRIRFLPGVTPRDLESPLEEVRTSSEQSGISAEDQDLQVVLDDTHEIKVSITAAQSGTLLVADTYYPGWVCTVDDQGTQIHEVYGCFRGVAISEGTHTVRMQYRPASFRWGCGLSLAGLVIWTLSASVAAFMAKRSRTLQA